VSSENQERSRSALRAGQGVVGAEESPGQAAARGCKLLTPEPCHASRRVHSPRAIGPLRTTRSHANAPVAAITGWVTATSAANEARSRMPARSCAEDTRVEWKARDLEHMAAALGPVIQAEHTVMRPRHLAGRWHQAAAGHGVMPSSNSRRRKYSSSILLIDAIDALQGFLGPFVVSLVVGSPRKSAVHAPRNVASSGVLLPPCNAVELGTR